MIHPGTCSVTLRGRSPAEVVAAAAGAGLTGVEWGADGHVPPGDLATARDVGARTRDAGLRVTSLGSYHRTGVHEAGAFADVLAAAVALGAPRVRVWAGDLASAQAGPDERARVAAGTADAVRRAGDAGVEVGLEHHGDTLTDTPASTAALLAAVDDLVGAPSLTTYWQPALDVPDESALTGLARLLPRVSTVHVFAWWPGTQRQPLSARAALWRDVLALLAGTGRDHDALLEFVADDDPAQLHRDAATLRTLLPR
ncbi:sugar phosphate isomerase/epimerase family protein [Kineococcus rubinsiae]|uniref:sugar phosphate isomerase/epimerase family protein n=1 Tax=Kineococcus rubinsiae TaxID=2609562 RepID=UPI00143034D1|nr:TIM barrel protein [Kineococcus rubinsiae]NIZ93634.1 TIM barrel protein [Kineococcus rubinsiae]